MKRSFLNKDVSKQMEINLIYRVICVDSIILYMKFCFIFYLLKFKSDSNLTEKSVVKPIDFHITPETLQNSRDVSCKNGKIKTFFKAMFLFLEV